MSDQPSPPPKPKPGSLRDRIAAFEKSASSAAPAPAPAPRPKPAGFSSWKPKVPSPPSSPSAASTDVQSSSLAPKAGGMSASDAKESITKAGSLKDRMAALQGKGAFGAPPPVAPKPTVEKPKWKPPPVVQPPADEGGDAVESSTAAVERTISPPVSVQSHESIDNVKSVNEGEEPATAPEGNDESEQTPVDPEEEERQRRAAIAARMARLGGARVGMAPPVFGKKPVRKPTQEEVVKTEEPKHSEEPSAPHDVTNAASDEVHLSPPINAIVSPPAEAPIQAESGVGKTADYFPKRKNSENASIVSSETTESNPSRTPTSMPVPSVPRRAGPPRKKPVKAPTLPPPELPEEKVEELDTPLPEADKPENISAEVAQDVEQPTLVEEAVRIIEKEDPEIMKDTSPEELASAEPPKDADDLQDEDPTLLAYRLDSPQISSSSVAEVESGTRSPPSALESAFDALDVDDIDDQEGFDGGIAASPPVPVHHTAPHALHADVLTPKIGQTLPETSGAPEVLEEDEEEEEARKKRVADRMAKMGGINPFAPPPSLVSPPAEGARSPPPSTALSPSPPVLPAPVVNSEPQELQSNLDSLPVGHALGAQKEDPVETKAEEESSDEEDEDDDVVDNTAYEQYEKSNAANLSQTETHRESVSVTSSPPISLATRPAVQVQQFEHKEAGHEDEDEESDYADDEEEEVSASPPPSSSNPPGHPSPARSPPTAHLDESPSPPARPAQPPRRIIPQAPEHVEEENEEEEEDITDEEPDERLATSQLFVPPPSGRGPIAVHPRHRYTQGEEDGNGSENDTPALPVPHRISMEVSPTAVAAAADKDVTEDEDDADSDHDGQALPIPPRHNAASVPRVISPLIPTGRPQQPLHHPPPIHRALPTAPQNQANLYHSPGHLTPSVSVGSEEILDEEEGDPIDPSFHSPSRQTSFVNLRSTAQVQAEIAAQAPIPTTAQPPPTVHAAPPTQSPPPPPADHPAERESEEDAERTRRKTIAERMAKLGGIRFGAAPIPTPTSRPQPRHEEEEEDVTASVPEEQPSDALSEEEEERARRERISAKLANMGGMRIGMMPMGMGGLPPQKSHVLLEQNVDRSPPAPAPAPQVRAMPPARPPPPPSAPAHAPEPQSHDTDSDYGASEDGVKVEAEESEAEAGYEHVEEVPPPVPSRDGRQPQHRQSTGPSTSSPPRPPVPTAMPIQRSSTIQSTKSSGGMSSGDFGTSPSQKRSSYMPQSEYVMVEEPESQETPPPPPARRVSRPPPARNTPQIPQTTPMVAQTSDLADSISSQWELPSIPKSSLDFGGGATDLSLSWTDAAEPTSPTATFQPSQSPLSTVKTTPSMSERQLSADALMALWGRVGVQVCEVATSLYEKSKKTLIGDGSYAGFIHEVLSAVPNAAASPSTSGEYGYVIYVQSGPAVQKRVSEIMPGDIVEIHDAKLKGHKGIQIYHQNVGGSGETLLGVVGEFEAKKSKIRVFQANQHVGQQTVESVSYRLEDLKSGTVKVYRVLDA